MRHKTDFVFLSFPFARNQHCSDNDKKLSFFITSFIIEQLWNRIIIGHFCWVLITPFFDAAIVKSTLKQHLYKSWQENIHSLTTMLLRLQKITIDLFFSFKYFVPLLKYEELFSFEVEKK